MTPGTALAAVARGDIGEIRRLADKGALSGLTDADKSALTRAAAGAGQAAMLRYLFEHHHLYGTDPDGEGRTLLHHAAMSGDAQTVRFTVETLGYHPLDADAHGVTALEYAHDAHPSGAYAWLVRQLGFGVESCYRNPVLRGFHPDPSIVRVGADYYMVHSSFTYFPGLPVSHSTDLIHWKVIGHAAEDLETSGLANLPGGYGYWAPDISYHKGRFWVVATLRRSTAPARLQMITSAENPRGPWDAPRFLPLDGIDPSLFTDDDGRRYILLNPGAMLAELSDDGELLSPPEMIYFGSARIKPEGPHLLKKNGWYYLFLAEGGTGEGHMETVARSKSLRGPYTPCPYGPILRRTNPHSPIGRSGHGKPVTTPDGRFMMVYLCGRRVEGDTLMGRETAIDPMTFTADGWPIVNGLRGPSSLQRAPFPGAAARPARNAEWISPRSDPASFARFDRNTIRIACGGDPAQLAPCSALLRRQTEAHYAQDAAVDMTRAAEGACAGLAGYYDERSFFLYGLRRTGAGCQLALIEQIGDARSETVLESALSPAARLRIEGDGMTRTLCVERAGVWQTVAQLRAAYLADGGVPGGKRFTGATVGLMGIGAGEAVFTGYLDDMWEA